jgi:NAD(P)-dependent dehydrogenase (short-subunit alcohol dehydrogenase family)
MGDGVNLESQTSSMLVGTRSLVTGGGSGIGAAIATHLAAAGSTVFICGRRAPNIQETASAIRATGGTCEPIEADVTSRDDVQRIASSVGTVDILVNNAGTSPMQPWDTVDLDAFRAVLESNLVAPFRLIQVLAPAMVERGYGRIVNVASIYGIVGGNPKMYPGLPWDAPAYVASKFGLVGLTKHLAVRFAPNGVTVNAVAPGPIWTPMASEKLQPAVVEAMTEAIPAARLGQPEDVSEVVGFLASRGSSFVTGQVIAVDGGWTSW